MACPSLANPLRRSKGKPAGIARSVAPAALRRRLPWRPLRQSKMSISTYGPGQSKPKERKIIEKLYVIMPFTKGIGYENMPCLVIEIPEGVPGDINLKLMQ